MKQMSWGLGMGMLVLCLAFAGCSTSPTKVTVPDVLGQTQAAAGDAITAAELKVGVVTEAYSVSAALGTVIRQSMPGGTSVDAGTAVALVISLGPLLVTVPDLGGKTLVEASAEIIGANLTVGTISEDYSATVPAGAVVSQNPAAGASVVPGSVVALTLSKGPQPVTVPDVVGQPQATAAALLGGAGLTVGAVTQECSATVPAGNVVRQDPAAGAQANAGSAVALVDSTGPCP